jgi:hypothetical protein
VVVVDPEVEDLLQKRARVRPPAAEYFTVREILAEASTVRPEPFGSELKAELLAAEGSLINDLPPAIRKISGQAILAGVGVQP